MNSSCSLSTVSQIVDGTITLIKSQRTSYARPVNSIINAQTWPHDQIPPRRGACANQNEKQFSHNTHRIFNTSYTFNYCVNIISCIKRQILDKINSSSAMLACELKQ